MFFFLFFSSVRRSIEPSTKSTKGGIDGRLRQLGYITDRVVGVTENNNNIIKKREGGFRGESDNRNDSIKSIDL